MLHPKIRVWWEGLRRPTGKHAARWRLLLAWAVIFTLVVAYALHVQRSDESSTNKNFCGVSQSFIKSTLDLRNKDNENEFKSIGDRRNLISEIGTVVQFLTPGSQVAPQQAAFLNSIVRFLRTEQRLALAQNSNTVKSIRDANTAIDEFRRERARLNCASD